jgi:hypothetical protein
MNKGDDKKFVPLKFPISADTMALTDLNISKFVNSQEISMDLYKSKKSNNKSIKSRQRR